MWLFFGIAAILLAVVNVIWMLRGREGKWFRFLSLACTAFTLCAFYSRATHWAIVGDASALLDVMPTLSKLLWVLTGASVAVNGLSLFKKGEK